MLIFQGVISRLHCPLVNGHRVSLKLTDGATVTYGERTKTSFCSCLIFTSFQICTMQSNSILSTETSPSPFVLVGLSWVEEKWQNQNLATHWLIDKLASIYISMRIFRVFSTVHFQRFQFKSKRHREQQWVSVHSSGGLQRSTAWVSGEKSQNKNCRRNLKRCVNRCEQNSAFNIIHVRCVCLTILEPLPRCRSQAPGFSCGWTSLKCKPLSSGLPCWWSF